jgi:hypothetical protein
MAGSPILLFAQIFDFQIAALLDKQVPLLLTSIESSHRVVPTMTSFAKWSKSLAAALQRD